MPETSHADRTAKARAARAALPPDALREQQQLAASASAAARRQQRDERITLTIQVQPAHRLDEAQLAAWRALWRTLLAPHPQVFGANAGEGEG